MFTSYQMTSVERLIEYKDLPPEAPLEKEDDPEKENWPLMGRIEADNISLRYDKSSPLVLKNINFVIKPKEKVRRERE